MKPLTTGERLLANKAFWSVIVRCSPFDAYWVDSTRSVSVRKVAGRRNLPVIPGAVHFGRYDASTRYADFIADLEATLKHCPASTKWQGVWEGERKPGEMFPGDALANLYKPPAPMGGGKAAA